MTDELRDRLNERATEDLVAILRNNDTEEWRPEVFPLVEGILRERGVDVAAVKAEGPLSTEVLEFAPIEAIATYSTSLEANLCRMTLVEAGIEAWLSTEHLAGIAPPLGMAVGVDLLVRAEDATSAREVLADLASGSAAIPVDPEPCPRCGSVDTEHSRTPDRLGAISSWALAGVPVPASEWRSSCKQCGHEWE